MKTTEPNQTLQTMTTEAQFKFDEQFLIESLRRNRRQWRGRYIFAAVKWIAGILFAAISAILFAGGNVGAGSIFIPIILVLIFAHRLDEPSIKRRFRKSPYYGANVRFVFSEEKIEISQEIARMELNWSAFTRAVTFLDGALLFQGDGMFNWLPRSSFSNEASFDRLLELINQKIKEVKTA